MQRALIDQSNIKNITLEDVARSDLSEGQTRLRIGRFALTANNVTYASTGFTIGYWHFFPSGVEGFGILPVWGFADVIESRSDVLLVGERLYGFFPMAEELVMEPRQLSGKTVLDASANRAKLPAVYNRYTKSPAKSPVKEGMQALLQPLLATSYLLCDWLQDNEYFDAKQIIVGSSSSKTGLGLCKFLAELPDRPVKVIGLTSAQNADFVKSQAGCDAVVTYDDIEKLDQTPSVYVDMAGNADVKARLHSHLAKHLRHSSAVGTSHWDQFQPKQQLAGPKPQFFFAPSQIEKRRADWGDGEIDRQISSAWKRIASEAETWLDLREHKGLLAAVDVYGTLADGRTSPRDGHVIVL